MQSGAALVEFTLAGIASIFLLICTFHLSIGMWNYHSLAQAVHETTRYIAVHGYNCTKPGYGCSIRVQNIASRFKYHAIGLPGDQVDLTLTTQSGAVTPCAPVNSCAGNTTVWPPATNSDNMPPNRVTVSAIYRFRSPLLFFWPGRNPVRFGEIWFPASSSQTLLF
jgi:hypothetical protein